MATRTLQEWDRRLRIAESDREDGRIDSQVLWEAISDLKEAHQVQDVWRGSAGSWEQKARDMQAAREADRQKARQREQALLRRIKKLEALVELARGEIAPMQAMLIKRLRAQMLAITPERIEHLAREIYREWMAQYGLGDGWEVESPVRRRDLGITVETVLRILERDLAGQDPTGSK